MLKKMRTSINVFISFFFISCAPSTIELSLTRPPEIFPEKIKKITRVSKIAKTPHFETPNPGPQIENLGLLESG